MKHNKERSFIITDGISMTCSHLENLNITEMFQSNVCVCVCVCACVRACVCQLRICLRERECARAYTLYTLYVGVCLCEPDSPIT